MQGPGSVKRGRGGIRDIEFSVQLLQLVHGRLDPALRARSTLSALAEIAAPGAERMLRATLNAAAPWGSCRPGEARSGDGDAQAVIGLECQHGRLNADVALDKGSGRLRSLRLAPPSDETCVP